MNIPSLLATIQKHQEFNRARETVKKEYHFIQNQGQYGDSLSRETFVIPQQQQPPQRVAPRQGVRNRLQLQTPRENKSSLEPSSRVIPVGTGRFIHNPF